MPEVEENNIAEALRKARDEGEFQGRVLTKLDNLADAFKNIEAKHDAHTIAIGGKASNADLAAITKKVERQERIIWMGLGALALLQFLIGAALTQK